jgi:hypothetical protein
MAYDSLETSKQPRDARWYKHPLMVVVPGFIALAAMVFAVVETSQSWNTVDPSPIAAPALTATSTAPPSSSTAAAPAPASTTTTSPTYMSGGWG